LAKEFNVGYQEAWAALQDGKWVRRSSWEERSFVARRDSMRDEFEGVYDGRHDVYRFYLDCVVDMPPGCLTGSVFPWSPSDEDKAGADWEMVRRPEQYEEK
jgi:hypothetical protein